MGAGSNALGFGGGFARGFANVMLRDSERKREDARLAEDRKFREFQVLQPTRLSHAEETGDWAGYQQWLTGYFPDLDKQFKKSGGSPFETLAPLLQKPVAGAQKQDVSQDQADAIGGATPGTPSPLPSRTLVSPATPPPPPDPKSILFGQAMPTREQKAARDANIQASAQTTLSTALMERARTVILPALKSVDPQATIHDALRVLGVNMGTERQATPPQPGSFGNAVQLKNAERAGQGQPPMSAPELQAYMIEWEQSQAEAQRGFGVDREALAGALFGKPFNQLDQTQKQVVIEEETKLVGKESQSRAEGTGQGRFNTPIDIPTAQSTGQQVGVTAAQVAGQNVPTMDQQTLLREMIGLQADMSRILGDGTAANPGLLTVLPSKDELGGKMPGATLALRRRDNTYREQIAQLESVVDSVLNVLARSRGQRGAQTEADAERAYNALVQMKATIFDPLRGDTRESAAARIKEAKAGLDRVIANIPKQAVPQPMKPNAAPATPTKPNAATPTTPAKPATAAPAGGSTGLKMDDKGNILDANGNILVAAGQ